MEQQQQPNSTPVTGYPAPSNNASYPYPPPPPYHPNHHYPHNYNHAYAPPQPYPRAAAVFRRFMIFIIALFIVFGAVTVTVWLVLRPRVPEFRVATASLANFSLSPSLRVAGAWSLSFEVLNPNKKMSVSYGDVQSSIFYDSQLLAQTLVPPFDQGTRNRTAVGASYSAAGSYVDSWVLAAVDRDRAAGTVRFNARVLAEVAFRAGGWRPRRRLLSVLCDDVPIGVSSNGGSGKLVGGPKDCRVDI